MASKIVLLPLSPGPIRQFKPGDGCQVSARMDLNFWISTSRISTTFPSLDVMFCAACAAHAMPVRSQRVPEKLEEMCARSEITATILSSATHSVLWLYSVPTSSRVTMCQAEPACYRPLTSEKSIDGPVDPDIVRLFRLVRRQPFLTQVRHRIVIYQCPSKQSTHIIRQPRLNRLAQLHLELQQGQQWGFRMAAPWHRLGIAKIVNRGYTVRHVFLGGNSEGLANPFNHLNIKHHSASSVIFPVLICV